MLRSVACLFRAAILCAAVLPAAISQTTEGGAAFEAADVHAITTTRRVSLNGPYVRGNHYEIRNATMLELISIAYGLDDNDVLGGPSWLEMNHYDVVAKAPAHSKLEAQRAMLQALLAERFGLAVHKDNKPMPAFGLTAKRPQLKKEEGAGEPGCKVDVPRVEPPARPQFVYTCHGETMEAFVNELRQAPMSERFMYGRPVVDQTELKGAWDFTFKYSVPTRVGADAADNISLFDALEKQLGLKLESVKLPVPVLIVDSVNQKPSANSPRVAQVLGVTDPPDEFEVATIKPTDPDFKDTRFNVLPSGQVNIRGVTLKFLLQQAYDLRDDQYLVGATKAVNEDRYDITAKAPASAMVVFTDARFGPPRPTLDFDTALTMIRKLLADRFKLAVHTEERMASGYTLTASKPKMKPADPASRTRFKEGPAEADPKADPRNKLPVLSRLVTCENMTMAQFAEKLQDMASGYIRGPVLDATGLAGSFDFTLSFSPIGAFRNNGRGRGGDAAPPAADAVAPEPTGAISLFEAIDKQLGLKLESKKRMMPMLVIDHVEPKPTEN
jgi:uncharacterized protein (TIGR03435 family)